MKKVVFGYKFLFYYYIKKSSADPELGGIPYIEALVAFLLAAALPIGLIKLAFDLEMNSWAHLILSDANVIWLLCIFVFANYYFLCSRGRWSDLVRKFDALPAEVLAESMAFAGKFIWTYVGFCIATVCYLSLK